MSEPEDENPVEVEARAGVAAAPVDAKSKKGVGNRGHGKIGEGPGKAPFENRDAELLWPEILGKLPPMGHSAYDLMVRVLRVDPPPREQIGRAFESSAVRGDGGSLIPGDALISYVTQYYHVPFQQGPAQYELQWVWKSTGQIFAMGTLRLPSRDAISAAYAAEWQRRQQEGAGNAAPGVMPPGMVPPAPPPMGFGAPPAQQQVQQPTQQQQAQQPQPFYGYPSPYGYNPYPVPQQPAQQPAQPPARDPEIDLMREEMREIKQLLRESITAKRDEGLAEIRELLRQREVGVGAAPTGPSTQSVQPLTEVDVTRIALQTTAQAVKQALAEFGFLPGQQRPGVGAPAASVAPVAPAAPNPVSQAVAGLDALEALTSLFDRSRRVTRRLEEGVMARRREEREEDREGVGAEVEQQQVQPEQPQMGVALVDVGTTWRDGRPVKAAVDPETGKFVFDQQGLMGIALGNPIIGEGILDIVQALKNKVIPVAGARPGVGAASGVQVREVPHEGHGQAPALEEAREEAPPPNGTAATRTPWVV